MSIAVYEKIRGWAMLLYNINFDNIKLVNFTALATKQ